MPATFTDKTGHTWTLDLTLGAAARVAKQTRYCILDPNAPPRSALDTDADAATPLLELIEGRDDVLGEILYAVLEPDITAAGLDETTFPERFNGAAIRDARRAWFAAWAVFFSDTGRQALAQTVAMAHEAADLAEEATSKEVAAAREYVLDRIKNEVEKLQATAPERLQAEIQNALARLGPGRLSGESPAPSASTPAA